MRYLCHVFAGRSLPSWQNLKPPASSHGQYDDDMAAEQQMSDDDLYLMNSKESSVLTSNLLTNESSELQLEIIGDSANLRALGNLCESMVSSVLGARTMISPICNHSFWVVSTSADTQSFYGPIFIELEPVLTFTPATMRLVDSLCLSVCSALIFESRDSEFRKFIFGLAGTS